MSSVFLSKLIEDAVYRSLTLLALQCFPLFVLTPCFQADVSKVIEVRDGAEGLTKEIIDAKFGSS